MSPADAAKILELPADATPEQLETRFLELRRKLEDKIAKAPTPGLQAKYRDTLAQITTAFETLTLAADSSSLPVLHKLGTEDSGPKSPVASAPTASSGLPARPGAGDSGKPHVSAPLARKPKGSSKEFVIVALIAVALLGAGGWWVMHLRAEKAEQVRIAAELAQKAAEEKAQAELAAKAEADRLTAQATDLRTKLAEARVEWEAIESDAKDAERRTSELKSELRSLRDASSSKKAELSAQVTDQESYSSWLKNYLLRHPAKIARARTEELLQAKEVDAATASCDEMLNALDQANHDIEQKRYHYFTRTGRLSLESSPKGMRWTMMDTYGNTTEGKTTALLENLPLTHLALLDGATALPGEGTKFIQRGEFTTGKYVVRFMRPGWPDVVKETRLSWDNDVGLSAQFDEGSLKVESRPAGIPFTVTNALGWSASGKAPATLSAVPPGTVTVRLSRSGYKDVEGRVAVEAGKTASLSLDQSPQDIKITVAEPDAEIWVDGKFIGRKEVTLTTYAPGKHSLELRHPKYSHYPTSIEIQQEYSLRKYQFSFAELSNRTETCPNCRGAGQFSRTVRCDRCGGAGTRRCGAIFCEGGQIPSSFFNANTGRTETRYATCYDCRGTGQVRCGFCEGSGRQTETDNCSTCGGRGSVSKLQLAQ